MTSSRILAETIAAIEDIASDEIGRLGVFLAKLV